MKMQAKTVKESQSEQTYILRSGHLNGYGRLFGGYLMQWMDELAVVVSRRHSNSEVTTVAIDNLNFKEGAYLGDMVVLVGKMTHVGSTSMEVRIDAYREDTNGIRTNINRAYFVMVAIDDKERPKKVPGLVISGESERAEWESGQKRYELRKHRRIEGF